MPVFNTAWVIVSVVFVYDCNILAIVCFVCANFSLKSCYNVQDNVVRMKTCTNWEFIWGETPNLVQNEGHKVGLRPWGPMDIFKHIFGTKLARAGSYKKHPIIIKLGRGQISGVWDFMFKFETSSRSHIMLASTAFQFGIVKTSLSNARHVGCSMEKIHGWPVARLM